MYLLFIFKPAVGAILNNSCIVCLTLNFITTLLMSFSMELIRSSSLRQLPIMPAVKQGNFSVPAFLLHRVQYLFICKHKLMLYLFMFYIIPVSPFSPFSPFLPSLPSLPGIPTFPSAPGGPLGPGLPGRPGGPGTLQIRRGAPFSLVSNSCPKTQWHRQTTPINAHILTSVSANSSF